MMDLKTLAVGLASGTFLGPFFSFIMEIWTLFQNISSKARWWIVFVGSFALPLAGWGVCMAFAWLPVPTTVEGWITAVAGEIIIGVSWWVSSQFGHANVNKRLVNTS